MAQLCIDIPDANVDEIVDALVAYTGEPKPTTAAGKLSLGRRVLYNDLKQLWTQYRATRAQTQTVTDPASPVATWPPPP